MANLDDGVREALILLDPEGRVGSSSDPLFLSVESADVTVGYLGLTDASYAWLAENAGPEFAQACRSGVMRQLGLYGPAARLPADPAAQLAAAARATVTGHAARQCVVRAMPLGIGGHSGTGIAYSADQATGEPGLFGVFRPDSTGAHLLEAGGQPLDELDQDSQWLADLRSAVTAADQETGYPVRAEFVVERGRLWIMRISQATLRGAGLLRAVTRSAQQGRLTPRQALLAVSEHDLAVALAPSGVLPDQRPAAAGLAASPGVATGIAVFSSDDAVRASAKGQRPVLVLTESRPEDLSGLLAAVAVVTQRGGHTSHAAVVTRGLGLPCVVALRDAVVDAAGHQLVPAGGNPISRGDHVTVDGTHGRVFRGAAAGGKSAAQPDLSDAATWLLAQADVLPGPQVRVSADSADEVVLGLAAGAAGVGLCRVEHMLLGDRKALVEQLLTAPPGPETRRALDSLQNLLLAEFAAILTAADGRPVTIRLIDPPRHEFLSRDDAMTELEPMLGVRGVRLNLLQADLAVAQLRALTRAESAVRRSGIATQPELLVPMITTVGELTEIRDLLGEVRQAPEPPIPVGAMIETPRAALLAGELARHADFLSIGTNDLTALVWAISRDNADAGLLPAYRELGLVRESPFVSFDTDGVGRLVGQAVRAARVARPGLPIGTCGEHGNSAEAARFFTGLGIDYVSCAPAQVPAARLACARAAISGSDE
ncbi:MAG TPA: putative PEP-binding protein [Streptosporangiaceae bacterium]|nr:putative PEP-binding protein [Streptosporangiaceae bacterium]